MVIFKAFGGKALNASRLATADIEAVSRCLNA
jgi:hypothetical protein